MRRNGFESRTGYSRSKRKRTAVTRGNAADSHADDDSREHRPEHRARDASTSSAAPTRLLIAALVILVTLLGWTAAGHAQGATRKPAASSLKAAPRWETSLATWYGPGFFGNGTACGQTLTPHTRGVAHRTLPCGSRITFKLHGRQIRVRVIDRGPYSAATWDLTGRSMQDLCGCRRPYTTHVRWHRGWGS